MKDIRALTDQDNTWSVRLLESEATYFRLAAESRVHPAATLCFMPRFRQMPAACVAISTTSSTTGASFQNWTKEFDGLVMERGFSLARIYGIAGCDLDESSDEQAPILDD